MIFLPAIKQGKEKIVYGNKGNTITAISDAHPLSRTL